MKTVTLQVVEGIDKGRIFRDLAVPVTIGREEGNLLRLNDERVSRFHAKIQFDSDDVILTDLDSTNGTRINGHPVQIRRLQAGDRVGIGRSTLIFGSNTEIAARIASVKRESLPTESPPSKTVNDLTCVNQLDDEVAADEEADRFWSASEQFLPGMPQKLTPSQAARVAEVLDFLHRGLVSATERVQAAGSAAEIVISFADWQKVQAVEMLLARYLRAVAEPDALVE